MQSRPESESPKTEAEKKNVGKKLSSLCGYMGPAHISMGLFSQQTHVYHQAYIDRQYVNNRRDESSKTTKKAANRK